MSSKTSFFNKTIFKKDITRLWPMWGLYSIYLFILLPYQTYLNVSEGKSGGGIYVATMPFVICFVAMLSAVVTFSYLFTEKSANMAHAFPVSRSELFTTHLISGYLFLAVPQIVMFLIAMPGYAMQGFHIGSQILPGLVYALAVDLIFYSMAVLCCFFAGRAIAAVGWFFILNGLYFVLRNVINIIANGFSYGTEFDVLTGFYSKWSVLFPGYYIMAKTGLTRYFDSDEAIQAMKYTGWGIVLGYCIAAVILLVLALFLYRKRHIEKAGEMNAFRFLDSVVRALACFCGGVFLGSLMAFISSLDDELHIVPFVIFFVIFSFICYLFSAIVLKKSFRVFSKPFWKELAVMEVLFLALIMVLAVKVSGDRERYVPETKDVAAAYVNCSYPVFGVEDDGIDQIRQLHKTLVSNKERDKQLLRKHNEESDSGEIVYVTVSYALKDKKECVRKYQIWVDAKELTDSQSSASALDRIENDYQKALVYTFSEKHDSIAFDGGLIESDYVGDSIKIPADAAQDIYAGVVQDMAQGYLTFCTTGRYQNNAKQNENAGSLYLTLTGSAEGEAQLVSARAKKAFRKYNAYYNLSGWDGFTLTREASGETSRLASGEMETEYECTLIISSDCKNTLKAFKKHDIHVSKKAFGVEE